MGDAARRFRKKLAIPAWLRRIGASRFGSTRSIDSSSSVTVSLDASSARSAFFTHERAGHQPVEIHVELGLLPNTDVAIEVPGLGSSSLLLMVVVVIAATATSSRISRIEHATA